MEQLRPMKMEKINVRFEYPDTLNYAVLQSGKDVSGNLLEVSSGTEWHDLKITITGDYLIESSQTLSTLPKNTPVRIDDLRPMPDADKLRRASESVQTTIRLNMEHEGELVFEKSYPIRILAFNEWPGMDKYPELLAAFVTPNASGLSSVKTEVGRKLLNITGDSQIDEYQTKDANRVRAHVAAVFAALRSLGIVYSTSIISFEQGQRIRLVPDILKEHTGNCLDLSILMASVLESIGLHPLLVVVPGHMFVGCWLVDKYATMPVLDDIAFLLNHSRNGVNEIVLVDAVQIGSDNKMGIEDAVDAAMEYIADDETPVTIIDVSRCRLDHVLPLPVEGETKTANGISRDTETDWISEGYAIDENQLQQQKGKDYRRKIWERKLLDFTLRNNLLNLRMGLRVMPLLPENIGEVEDILQAGKELTLVPMPDREDSLVPNDGLKHGYLFTGLGESDLAQEVKHLYRESRTSLEENGANTLFVGFGVLKWFETEKSVQERYAPLLLLPVQLVRKSAGTYVLRGREEDMTVNTTLIEFLRQQFDIHIKGLDPLPVDDSGYDIDLILATLRSQLKDVPRWEVQNGCLLGLFSFAKFVMWNDIHSNFDKIVAHPVIDALVKRSTLAGEQEAVDIHEIDENVEPKELCVPISADSSQLSAIAAAGQGQSYIMYGPPGTGKSQTITNIIANALRHDKRVLFVAEKAAALQVVQHRLEGIGIGDFCLELHSNKATRNHLLEQLQQALNAVHTAEPADYEAKSKDLFERRSHLQHYIDALHRKGDNGLSVYDCITGFVGIDGEPLMLDRACITPNMKVEQIRALAQKIASLESVCRLVGSPAAHPLHGLNVTDDSLTIGDRLHTLLATLQPLLQKGKIAMEHYGAAFTLSSLAEVCEGMEQYNKVEEAKAALLQTWVPEALDLKPIELQQQWEEAKDTFVLVRYFKKRSFVKRMKVYCPTMTTDNADSQITQLMNYSRMRRDLSENSVRAGSLPSGEREALQQLRTTCNELSAIATFEDNDLNQVVVLLSTWLANTGKTRDWAYWCKQKAELESIHLSPAVEAVIVQGDTPDFQHTADLFMKAVYRQLAIEIIDADQTLSSFRGPVFEDSIKQYRRVAREFTEVTCQELYHHLVSRVPQHLSEPSAKSEMGKLRRYITSRGRGMTIRNIFEEVPNVLRRLCPCMLMSPISVAQYMSLDNEKFDIVIFDEASQMPTAEAVGTIARGNALVCAGDPKQLPPTSFFTADTTDESEAEYDDMESILDDCRTIGMQPVPLQWHYRSKSESLITFSNQEYYEGQLFTFPSVSDRVSMVRFVPVDGTYDFGRTRSNRAEAEAIADEVIRRWLDPVLSKSSIGIVAFSKVQQDLIDDVLSQRVAGHADLEAMMKDSDEPLFIKNLENVQGDERDVILFSIGYGPDKRGHVSMNFGPLNNKGGERRLNVAVSRARKEMVVFSTLKPEQIDLRRTSAKGVEGLKKFLEFARDGHISVPSSQIAGTTKSVSTVEAIADAIRDMGYSVDTNVGRSSFKIDIAVVDPKDKSHYLLGILCDGENYYGTKTERDREIIQPSVLRGLGWSLMRVWSIDWFVNREKELERIREMLKKAKEGKLKAPEVPEPSKKLPMPEPTEETHAPLLEKQADATIDDIPAGKLDKAIRFVVSQSISIPEDELKKATAKVLGFARNGNRIDQVLTARINDLVDSGVLCRQGDDITILD